ncbi:MAG TPA: ferritin-like domain-containing protein [Salinimicrobium sp.]|nr:ferritin-like domain-containing protein [Salinimicrobium sp.]
MKKPLIKVHTPKVEHLKAGNSRRNFLKIGGLAMAGSSLLLYSCSDDDDMPMPPEPPTDVFDLGSGDLGILNYAYALEQLEAAFYTEVKAGGYFSGASAEEKQVLEDIYEHEVIHREFFKAAISGVAPADKVLPELEFDFSTVDFSSRESVLETSILLEDTGCAAYNGAGSLLESKTYLLLAGKIVSVEARHASAIRSIYLPGNKDFAGDDVVNESGLGLASPPSEIITKVGSTGFVVTPFTANELPSM